MFQCLSQNDDFRAKETMDSNRIQTGDHGDRKEGIRPIFSNPETFYQTLHILNLSVDSLELINKSTGSN